MKPGDEWETVPSAAPSPAGQSAPAAGEWETVGAAEGASAPEAFVRGGIQGLTSGFGDEIGAGIDYLLTGKDYKASRDAARAANEAAKASHPVAYGAGDVGGGVAQMFIPGLNVAGKASTLGRIGTAAVLGGIGGAGYSNAENVADVGTDAAIGMGTGAVFGTAFEGAGRLIGGAARRADNRVIQGITEGAKPSTGEKLVGRAGERRPDVLSAVREDPALVAAARSGDADKLYKAAASASERLNTARDIFYTQVDRTGARVDPADALGAVMEVRQRLARSPATIGQADALAKVEDQIARAWDKSPGLTARELREEVTKLQTEARSYYRASLTGGASPEAAEAKKAAADTLRNLLHQHVEDVAQANKLPAVGVLKDLNKKLSIMADIEDAAAQKATREAKVPPHRLGQLFDTATAVANPYGWAAKKILVDSGLAREAAMIADDKLAAITRAAEGGASGARLKAIAMQLGVGAAAADVLGVWAQQQFGQVNGQRP